MISHAIQWGLKRLLDRAHAGPLGAVSWGMWVTALWHLRGEHNISKDIQKQSSKYYGLEGTISVFKKSVLVEDDFLGIATNE